MYVLINIYAPNKDSNIVSFFNNLLLILRNNNFDEEENIIMGGDFNCPLNPLMDKKGGQLNHAAITLELVYKSDDIKGPGIWKMNCSLLDDEDYVNGITERIPIWLAEGRKDLSNCRSIWDWLKYNIRAHTIQYSKRKARERSEKKRN
ncbi:unnamed protein product, partial [Porites lobata]